METRQWSIVTGGNRGLGFEVARSLVARGRPIIIAVRDEAAGDRAAAELRAVAGARVEVLRLDASSGDSIAAFAAEVGARFPGQIDLLVNNAGIFIDSFDAPSHAATVATNTDGPVDVTLALLPHLARGARVVMVASALGQLGALSPDYVDPIRDAATLDEVKAAARRFDPGSPLLKINPLTPSYSVSKAALIRATQILAEAPGFAAKGITVVSVCPGWCRTDMSKAAEEKTGARAPRTAQQGAASILAAALKTGSIPNGSFSRDGALLDWTAKPASSVPGAG